MGGLSHIPGHTCHHHSPGPTLAAQAGMRMSEDHIYLIGVCLGQEGGMLMGKMGADAVGRETALFNCTCFRNSAADFAKTELREWQC